MTIGGNCLPTALTLSSLLSDSGLSTNCAVVEIVVSTLGFGVTATDIIDEVGETLSLSFLLLFLVN